jgi:hypothetical protein
MASSNVGQSMSQTEISSCESPAVRLLVELNNIPNSSTPMIELLLGDLWMDYMSGKINLWCNGPSKKHRCILCCSRCRQGLRCCYECHRCKYNSCAKHNKDNRAYRAPNLAYQIYDPYFYTLFGLPYN